MVAKAAKPVDRIRGPAEPQMPNEKIPEIVERIAAANLEARRAVAGPLTAVKAPALAGATRASRTPKTVASAANFRALRTSGIFLHVTKALI